MTREQNLLIKKLKSLSPEELASVRQFMEGLKASKCRPPSPAAGGSAAVATAQEGESTQATGSSAPEVQPPAAAPVCAAGAGWRRRPFQAVDADDLQPIAALFREAVDSRAAARLRFGSR